MHCQLDFAASCCYIYRMRKRKRLIHGNIKRLRLARGLSQEALGEALGQHRTTVSKWESGPNAPKLDDLAPLADELNVSIDDLVRGQP